MVVLMFEMVVVFRLRSREVSEDGVLGGGELVER